MALPYVSTEDGAGPLAQGASRSGRRRARQGQPDQSVGGMDTSALKSFAPEVRRQLLEAVERKLDFVLTGDTADLRAAAAQVERLRAQAQAGRAQLIERVAYTWFNRLAALRFLDARGWHPFRVRVADAGLARPRPSPRSCASCATASLPEELKPLHRPGPPERPARRPPALVRSAGRGLPPPGARRLPLLPRPAALPLRAPRRRDRAAPARRPPHRALGGPGLPHARSATRTAPRSRSSAGSTSSTSPRRRTR